MIFRASSYRPRGGARVPLVFESGERSIGFIPIDGDQPDLSQRRSADSFLRRYPMAKIIMVTESSIAPRVEEERVLISSAASLV
jgi:hypothetical protein